MTTEHASALASLFIGNTRSFGQFDPNTGRMWAEKVAYTDANLEAHVAGETGIGMVPILDDASVRFAAIDIDCHKGKPEIDLVALDSKIREYDLPLVVCRSKSGGAHLYLFTSEPVPAKVVRPLMAGWAARLGWPGVEVFPKQSALGSDADGTRSLGNWINLPYFDAERTERYCLHRGEKLPLDAFVGLARTRAQTYAALVAMAAAAHPEAPPCFQRMIAEGLPTGEGVRNKGLWHAAVYLRRAFPDDYTKRAMDFNESVLDTPLPVGEARKTISSAGRRDYRYKCNEEPCKSLCNRAVCLTRKFGIVEDKHPDEGELPPLPEMKNLQKYLSEPVRWSLEVNGKTIYLSSDQLMEYRRFRVAVAEELTILIPGMKNERWHPILTKLMETAQLVEVPDEASTPGQVRVKLEEFIKRADLKKDGTNTADREVLLRGVPVVQVIDDKRVVLFRGMDFVEFLKKTRSEELKGVNLWMALRMAGVNHRQMRIGATVVPIWFLPIGDKGEVALPEQKFETDL